LLKVEIYLLILGFEGDPKSIDQFMSSDNILIPKIIEEMFEDAKGIIRGSKSKNRQHNGQQKKNK